MAAPCKLYNLAKYCEFHEYNGQTTANYSELKNASMSQQTMSK